MNNVAKFLEGRGLPNEALEVATDPDYRFELAVQLGELETALSIAEDSESEGKWRQLGELAMSAGKLDVRPAIYPLHESECASFSLRPARLDMSLCLQEIPRLSLRGTVAPAVLGSPPFHLTDGHYGAVSVAGRPSFCCTVHLFRPFPEWR
jgi:hypothetical protein